MGRVSRRMPKQSAAKAGSQFGLCGIGGSVSFAAGGTERCDAIVARSTGSPMRYEDASYIAATALSCMFGRTWE